MIPPKQFFTHVIAPVLRAMAETDPRFDTLAARRLLLGTAVEESRLAAIVQKPNGPALSFFQIEPATHADIRRWAAARNLDPVLDEFVADWTSSEGQLAANAAYACAVARMFYFRIPEPLPAAGDLTGMGRYWKQYFNTRLGKGSAIKWERTYRQHCMEAIPDGE